MISAALYKIWSMAFLTDSSGSLQRSKKRSREDELDGERQRNRVVPRIDHAVSANVEHQNPASNPASEALSADEDMSSLGGDTLEKTTSTTTSREWNTRRIPDLSFILHPSHEVSSPEDQASNAHARQPSDGAQRYVVIERTCSALGLRHRNLEQLYVSLSFSVRAKGPLKYLMLKMSD